MNGQYRAVVVIYSTLTAACCTRPRLSPSASREPEYEAERARKDELQKARTATFERIVQDAPATFTAAQLRVLLRALVNLDPCTFTDDLAEQIAGEDENEQRSAEEVLLSAIERDGRGGIKGGCSTCFSLFDLYQARLSRAAYIRRTMEKARRWVYL